MGVRAMKHAALLQAWSGRIAECRSSGKTVTKLQYHGDAFINVQERGIDLCTGLSDGYRDFMRQIIGEDFSEMIRFEGYNFDRVEGGLQMVVLPIDVASQRLDWLFQTISERITKFYGAEAITVDQETRMWVLQPFNTHIDLYKDYAEPIGSVAIAFTRIN